MDAEQDWAAEEPEYWEDDELTEWFDSASAVDSAPSPQPENEGSLPDLIAAVLEASGDPALMTDADLVDSLAAWHAVASRAAGRELRATEELLRRRKPRVWDRRGDRAETKREDLGGAVQDADGPGRVMPAVVASREAAAEIALALTATEYSAHAQAELAAVLSRRLPAAFAELDAGRADLNRVRVLAEATQFLSDADAGKVDATLAGSLGEMTTGELRDKARKAVIKIDPKGADSRRKRAERKARFALYGNDDQTATAAVERMPAQLGAAVRARVNAIARAARAAGMTDPMPLLEAKIATGLLLDTLPHIPPPAAADGGPGPESGPDGPWGGGWPGDWFTGPFPPVPVEGDGQADGVGEPGPDNSVTAQPGTREPGTDDSDADGSGTVQPGADDSRADEPRAGDPDVDDSDADEPLAGEPGTGEPGTDEPGTGELGSEVLVPDVPGGDAGSGDSGGEMGWPLIPAQAGAAGPGCMGVPSWLRPKDPGRIRLLVPWRSLLGTGPEPAELSWIGPITPAQARDLAAAAAVDPGCAWQLIITDDHGRAIAETTLRTPRGERAGPPGLVSQVTLTISQSLAAAYGRDGPASDRIARALDLLNPGGSDSARPAPDRTGQLAGLLAKAVTAANLAATQARARTAADRAAGGCAHTREQAGYRVTGPLRRWLDTRDRTCRSPVCRQPATRCDADHTIAYHRGGRTCSCDLGALCRTHHELKQLPGWHLTQDTSGTFTWTTPAGLTYRKEPHRYAF